MNKSKILLFALLFLLSISFSYATITTTGNTITDGSYKVVTLLSNGSFNTTETLNNVTILMIGGGGSGGTRLGAGGGAGGIIYNSSYTINSGNYDIVIGRGGESQPVSSGTPGKNGSDTTFNSLRAIGGGGGGSGGAASYYNGRSGGSGGGATGGNLAYGGNGTFPQGLGGGNNTASALGGAGGGGYNNSGAIPSGSAGGNGGNGINYSINGTNIYYAGGGGGSAYTSASAGTGGLGGGGNGSVNDGTAINGTNGLGAGGGGSGQQNVGPYNGGISGGGGSGIVIIRYLEASIITKSYTLNMSASNDINSSTVNDIYYNTTVSGVYSNATIINLSQFNNSYATFYYRLNTSLNNGCAVFSQKTCISNSSYISKNMTKINSSLFSTDLDDNDYLPAYYPYNPVFIEYTDHLNYSAYNNNNIKFNVYNFSTSAVLTFLSLEFMAINESTNSLQIYYCNSSYSTSSNPATNNNCVNVANFGTVNGYNHVHDGNKSKHQVVQVNIQNITKTQNSSFIFIAGNTINNGWKFGYVLNSSYDNSSFNIGYPTQWDVTPNIFDIHLHQFTASDYLEYYSVYNDTNDTTGTSATFKDYMNITPQAPSTSIFYSPLCNEQYTISSTNNAIVLFNWSIASDFYNLAILYNLSIIKENSLSRIILNSSINGTTYSYNVNTSVLTNGNYEARIQACNSGGLCTISEMDCYFNICENSWTRTLQPCLNSLKLINYSDSNNCNAQYNIPSDEGSYEACIMPPTKIQVSIDNEIVIHIILIVLIILSMVIALKSDGIYKSIMGITGILFIVYGIIFQVISRSSMTGDTYNILSAILGWSFLLIGLGLIIGAFSIILSSVTEHKKGMKK
jgi:hypothetical protein